MPRKTFKCVCELTIHSVRSPGTWLPNRDDIYLTVEIFNSTKRTRITDPIFPLIFHERFFFEKTFWSATDPMDVVEMLEDVKVSLELRQVADIYLGGTLLAYFDGCARDFFYPAPCTHPRMINDRELIMSRTCDFPGISPRMEFSTYTVIEELTTPYMDAIEDAYLNSTIRSSPRPYWSRAIRSKSTPRPPFVVRKTDSSALTRTPTLHDTYCLSPVRTRRCRSATRCHQGLWSKYYTELKRAKSARFGPLRASGRSRSPSPVRSSPSPFLRDDADCEVSRITRRYRSPSPLTRSALSRAADIRRRVDETLRWSRARSLSPESSRLRRHRSCDDNLSDLETDLMLAKHRRYQAEYDAFLYS